jgi:hypothetical protein
MRSTSALDNAGRSPAAISRRSRRRRCGAVSAEAAESFDSTFPPAVPLAEDEAKGSASASSVHQYVFFTPGPAKGTPKSRSNLA